MADRRQQPDRRDRTLRRASRRKGDQRLFAIELDPTNLRVAQLDRSGDAQAIDPVSASIQPWRVEATALQTPEGLAELTAAFREVSRRHAIHGAEIRMVLSGAYCIMRTIRGSVEEVRAELAQLEQRSRLYLSLGPGEKVLVASVTSLDARHAHALAAACNRATLETIQAAAEATGIEIAVIEPALSALNRAVARLPEAPKEPYLLIHVTDQAMEVGVCHEGQLLLDYRPGGQFGAIDLPTLIENHLNRLSRHVGRCLRTAPPELKRIYLCGDETPVAEARKMFARYRSLEVSVVRAMDVQATWSIPSTAIDALTAATLGGLLAAYLPEADRDSPNLMRHILERKREPLRPKLIRSAIPLAATLLLAAGLSILNGYEQASLDEMQAELDGLAVAEGRASELRLQLLSSQAKLAQLTNLAGQLPSDLSGESIRRLAGCMPSDVWLSRLEVVDRTTVSLTGASYLEAGVYDFVRWLEQAPGFAEVALRGTNASSSATGPTTNFELQLNLAQTEEPAKSTTPQGQSPPAVSQNDRDRQTSTQLANQPINQSLHGTGSSP